VPTVGNTDIGEGRCGEREELKEIKKLRKTRTFVHKMYYRPRNAL
jgi:hypothetical protein